MEPQDKHLSPTLIREFAEEKALLQPHELRHFQDCDRCSDLWWKIRQEIKYQNESKDKTA